MDKFKVEAQLDRYTKSKKHLKRKKYPFYGEQVTYACINQKPYELDMMELGAVVNTNVK